MYQVVAILLTVVVLAHCKSCDLADHIAENQPWLITPPKNIYGNETVPQSIVNTSSSFDTEEAINEQINRELFAQYNYISLVAHFSRDDNYLPGFAKFFKESAEEEHKHAMMFIDYQNKRGGRVKLQPILQPCKDQWGNGLMAMQEVLKLEKLIYRGLLALHDTATKANDPQLLDFIEGNFLGEQIDAIKLLGNYIGTLQRVGNGLGEYQFDKITLGGGK